MKLIKILLISVLFIPLSFQSFAAPTGQDLGDKWCSDVKMHFYAGGPEAGGFAGIVAAGAMNAAVNRTTTKARTHLIVVKAQCGLMVLVLSAVPT